jgi:RNA-directed DNA polymerase
MNKRILKEFLKSGISFQNQVEYPDMGTPQGEIISPSLANFALDNIEDLIPKDTLLVGYADDFIVISKSKSLLEQEVKPVIENFLSIRGLKLNESKTKITNVQDGFEFLGYHFKETLSSK